MFFRKKAEIAKNLSLSGKKITRAFKVPVFHFRLWIHCAQMIRKNRLTQQAAALAYHTVFGIVPLAIVMLFIFQAIGDSEQVSQKVKNMVYENLQLSNLSIPDSQTADPDDNIMLTNYLDSIVGKYFTGLGKGTMTIVSIVLVIWAAISLLGIIERTFNNIWHVQQPRSFLHRVINYWAVLTLGPLLIGLGLYLSTKIFFFNTLHESAFGDLISLLNSLIIPAAAFFLLYFVLPNTKVQTSAALYGAVVAAIVWTTVKFAFGYYVKQFIPYAQIYGVLGLIPMSILWIYIMWTVALLGLQVAFTVQHFETLETRLFQKKEDKPAFVINDLTVIEIVRTICKAFKQKQAPLEADEIYSRLSMPVDLGSIIIDHLVTNGILVKCTEPHSGYMPARDPGDIKLSELVEVIDSSGYVHAENVAPATRKILDRQKELLAEYSIASLLADNQQPDSVNDELNAEEQHEGGTSQQDPGSNFS
jgi:membrane protein